MLDASFIARHYQERYTSRVVIDGTPVLAQMIQSRLPAEGIVLDLGAGSGGELPHPCKRPGITLIGVDSSTAVETNESLDSCLVQDAADLPFAAGSIDAVFSDFTIEHLEYPEPVVIEVSRVLKSGAPFVFRTVNVFHYVPICASLLRGRLRDAALRNSGRLPEELFPTYYRLNNRRAIIRLLRRHQLEVEEIRFVEGPPVYLTFSRILYTLGIAYERIANLSPRTEFLRANILVAARKRD